MLPTHPPSLAGGEATASPCTVDKAWTVGSDAYEGSDTSAEWLLTAATVGRCGGCSVGRAGAPKGGKSPWVGQLRAVGVAAENLFV